LLQESHRVLVQLGSLGELLLIETAFEPHLTHNCAECLLERCFPLRLCGHLSRVPAFCRFLGTQLCS
jgi:hypothetical protein